MWPSLFILALAALWAIHRSWRKRYSQLHRQSLQCSDQLTSLQHRLHQASAAAAAQQQALLNSMVEGVLLLDSQNRVLLANHALEQLFGIHSDIANLTVMEAFRAHELDELVRQVARQDTVTGFYMELTFPSPKSLEINASSIKDQTGFRTGTTLVFHDLTRLKKLENTRKEFVANVSHELRTPLSLIKGYIETLQSGAVEDPATSSKFLNVIRKNTDRLIFLIEDLLTISHLESGKASFNIQNLPLAPILHRVMDDLSGLAAEKSIQLKTDASSSLTVRADSDRIQQVLYNLVENAIKYGHTGGLVTVSAHTLNREVEVAVTDDGPGIPSDSLERIFERFYRVERSRAREAAGTGLGLSIVKHIIHSHHGRVWVESEPNHGSTFRFTLPSGPPQPPAA